MELIRPTLASQGGVVSRAQLRALELEAHDIRRLLRRHELSTIHPGVYVDHTGDPSWVQRAWAAVLFCWPAGLAAESAMRAADGPGRRHGVEGPIRVVIGRDRRVVAPSGVRVVRTFDLDRRVLWNLGPPRMRYDEAALDVALDASGEFGAIGAVARAVQSQHTTAARMRAALDTRSRAPRRDFIAAVLDDVARGACSVLEHGYLTRVETPHGLPTAHRQQRGTTSAGVVYRDATYGVLDLELDGRLFHDTAEARDADFERDLDGAVDGRTAVRLSWGQVFDRGCSTAAKVSRLLVSRGWPGGHACGPGCALAAAA
ncbi:type IV toxin-antitoxin system AbiEi family antitoxin domain-containing protein [Nocardioides sp.]|uniref:type IV toxin-antitoxin system AbiEi family antitoxin domain-containing protein n=1 Tax=Nocardioides sp. TaxID=35761 RepID=UPI00261E56A6|nr:type IV toxin-antitoxin system AbiEi family antitoxin domain-containing protein [Nocardioides sp.]MCW2736395.1 hypothetical protein [Nocardioides sp.]